MMLQKQRLATPLKTLIVSILLSFGNFAQNDLLGKWSVDHDTSLVLFEFTASGHANVRIGSNTLGGEYFLIDDNPVTMKYVVNEKTTPKQIDLVIIMIEYNMEISRMPGIFQFEGEKLNMAIRFDETQRPTSFDGDDAILLTRLK